MFGKGDKKHEGCGDQEHDKAFGREVRHDWGDNDAGGNEMIDTCIWTLEGQRP